MDGYNAVSSRMAQADLCNAKNAPHFAPESGLCWSCRKQIYEPLTRKMRGFKMEIIEVTTGISVEKATKELITGCPHCNRSYCS